MHGLTTLTCSHSTLWRSRCVSIKLLAADLASLEGAKLALQEATWWRWIRLCWSGWNCLRWEHDGSGGSGFTGRGETGHAGSKLLVVDLASQVGQNWLHPEQDGRGRSGFTGSGSVSNGCKFPGQYWVLFHLKLDCGNGSYHTKNPDRWKWAGFTTKNPAFQFHNFASN